MSAPASFPKLDAGEREAIAKYATARIAYLHHDLEHHPAMPGQSEFIRGAIAELRALLGNLYPKISATPDLERPPLY